MTTILHSHCRTLIDLSLIITVFDNMLLCFSFNIRLSLSPTQLFNPTNLPISMTCFTFSVTETTAPLILSLSNVLHSRSRSFMHHAPVFWNSLPKQHVNQRLINPASIKPSIKAALLWLYLRLSFM